MKELSGRILFSIVLALLITSVLVVSNLSCKQREETGDKIMVAVTILPQAEFVESVGGEKVEVIVMVPPGANIHIYEPTPSQMNILASAKMYAKVGSDVEFERTWMDKLLAVNRDMLVVDCAEGIELQEMVGGHEREESHGATDPHIWLSPRNAGIMVQNICQELVQVDPENSAYYEKNRDAYLQELDKLDRDIRDNLSAVANRTFMVYHPTFGYFARDYNLVMIPVEEEGKEPTAARLAYLIGQAREQGIKVVFAEPQFNPQSAEVIAEAIGGRVVFVDTLARDYIRNMRMLWDELVQVME